MDAGSSLAFQVLPCKKGIWSTETGGGQVKFSSKCTDHNMAPALGFPALNPQMLKLKVSECPVQVISTFLCYIKAGKRLISCWKEEIKAGKERESGGAWCPCPPTSLGLYVWSGTSKRRRLGSIVQIQGIMLSLAAGLNLKEKGGGVLFHTCCHH